tara:strand:+ start:2279 stop:2971 length:693 start_codon:yes stop_codon:yes gene_type:complete
MQENESKQDLSLKELDQCSKDLGIGGYLSPDTNEDKYRERMKRRNQIQTDRVQKRNAEKGLIIVFTGKGKGKTTAALGMALRTIGHGKKVAIIQFIKGGWEPGETRAFKFFGDLITWHALGEGFTWETQDRKRDKELALTAWNQAIKYLESNDYKLVILDEINLVIKLGYISFKDVLSGLRKRPSLTHVVLTGRDANKELIEKADLVTEMNLIHHPFREQGVKAQIGIEF